MSTVDGAEPTFDTLSERERRMAEDILKTEGARMDFGHGEGRRPDVRPFAFTSTCGIVWLSYLVHPLSSGAANAILALLPLWWILAAAWHFWPRRDLRQDLLIEIQRDLFNGKVATAQATVGVERGRYVSRVARRNLRMNTEDALALRDTLLPHRVRYLPESRLVLALELPDVPPRGYRAVTSAGVQRIIDIDLIRDLLGAQLRFAPGWYPKNRLGRMNAGQWRLLFRPRLHGSLLVAAIPAALLAGAAKLAGAGGALPLLLFLGSWALVWALVKRPSLLDVGRDIAAGRVLSVEGPLEVTGSPRPAFIIGEHAFTVTEGLEHLVFPGLRYRAFYAPRSLVLVGIELLPHDGPPAAAGDRRSRSGTPP